MTMTITTATTVITDATATTVTDSAVDADGNAVV
jgi:hypothetical protein